MGVEIPWGGNPMGNPMGWKSHGVEIPWEIQWGGNPMGNPMGWKSHGVEIPLEIQWGGNPMGSRPGLRARTPGPGRVPGPRNIIHIYVYMAASHLFSNKKNSKDPQHMNFGKRTGAGPWWALPWALVGPCGDRALRGPWALVGP